MTDKTNIPCGAKSNAEFCGGGRGNKAFCAYVNIGGQLLDCKPLFKCPYNCPDVSSATAQLSANQTTVSFPNIRAPTIDVLTIPVQPYTNIKTLIDDCDKDTTLNVVKQILRDGRNNACEIHGICDPRAQCFHLPGSTSVDWIHLHTLNNKIPKEKFPCVPGIDKGCPLYTKNYVCISSNQEEIWKNIDMGAKTIIGAVDRFYPRNKNTYISTVIENYNI